MDSVHDMTPRNLFECTHCNKTFNLKNSYRQHIVNVHEKASKPQCNLCKKYYYSAQELQNHVRRIHDKIKDFKCDLCDRILSRDVTYAIKISVVLKQL